MRILIILALTAPIFAQPVTGLSAHYIDIGSGGQSLAVAADSSGGHYIVSTVIEDSGRRQIRVTKTDVQGDEAGHFDFGGSGPDTPAGIAVD
ncbi:MAG TPA: hypothetical protein VFW83_04510, partial [Bryobacteraceae bacterium]|nr:hypothetical protein [Bryobacteraceae bacterium]